MKSRKAKLTRRLKGTAKVTAAACVLAGCSSTYVITERANECNINKGVPYYLPKRLTKVTVTKRVPPSEGYDALLNDLPPIADPCQAYVAIPVKHWLRSDVVDIRTSPDGLLSSAYITGELRNAGIQDNIRLSSVFFNKEGLKDELNRNLHFTEDARNASVAGHEPGIVEFEAAFDAGSPPDIAKVNESLKRFHMQLEVPVADGCGPVQPQVDHISGLVFRPAIQRPVYVKSTKHEDKVIASINGVTPDQAPLFNLPLKDGFLAHHSHNLEMREGVVTGYYSRNPSEIHGFFTQSQELVEDVGSVVAAVIAPLAAALDVKRTADSQAEGGGGGAAADTSSAPASDNSASKDDLQKLQDQNAQLQQSVEDLKTQQAAPGEQASMPEQSAVEDLLDVLPKKKNAVAQKTGIDNKALSAEKTSAVAMPASNNIKSSEKETAAAPKSSSHSKRQSASAGADTRKSSGATDPGLQAASAIFAAAPTEAAEFRPVDVSQTPAERPSLLTRMKTAFHDRSIKPLKREQAPDEGLSPLAGRPDTLPTSSNIGIPPGEIAAAAKANLPYSTAGQAITNPTSSDPGVSGYMQEPAPRGSLLSRLNPFNRHESVNPGSTPEGALQTPMLEPAADNPELAALPARSSRNKASQAVGASYQTSTDGAVSDSEFQPTQDQDSASPRPSLFSRITGHLPHRNSSVGLPASDYVAPAPVDAPAPHADSASHSAIKTHKTENLNGRTVAAPKTATPSQAANVTLYPPANPELSSATPNRTAAPSNPAAMDTTLSDTGNNMSAPAKPSMLHKLTSFLPSRA